MVRHDHRLTITVEPGPDGTVVRVAGDLEYDTGGDAVAVLGPLADAGTVLLLDLTGTEFMDSTGLSVLIRTRRAAERNGGSLRVVAMTPRVEQLLQVTGTYDLLAGEPG